MNLSSMLVDVIIDPTLQATMSTAPLKYGLPLRPPTASTALWAHILRQDTTPSDTPIVVPPTVPLDKNATSMRVLLHDTQANFEKFARHVGKLIDGVNETKHEIKTTNDLFERDRQTLVGDIIDLGTIIPLSLGDLSREKAHICPRDKSFSFFQSTEVKRKFRNQLDRLVKLLQPKLTSRTSTIDWTLWISAWTQSRR